MTILFGILAAGLVGAGIAWFIWRRNVLATFAMLERILVVGFFALSALGCFAADNIRGGLIAAAIAIVLNGLYMFAFHRARRAAAGSATGAP